MVQLYSGFRLVSQLSRNTRLQLHKISVRKKKKTPKIPRAPEKHDQAPVYLLAGSRVTYNRFIDDNFLILTG